ncbi:hypothetical protein Apmu_0053_08 [Acidiphilium multivorum AIU301]|nr:hypothetical protein Apmu_0053_08 [Acidiphilium multivorum AIU301]
MSPRAASLACHLHGDGADLGFRGAVQFHGSGGCPDAVGFGLGGVLCGCEGGLALIGEGAVIDPFEASGALEGAIAVGGPLLGSPHDLFKIVR